MKPAISFLMINIMITINFILLLLLMRFCEHLEFVIIIIIIREFEVEINNYNSKHRG